MFCFLLAVCVSCGREQVRLTESEVKQLLQTGGFGEVEELKLVREAPGRFKIVYWASRSSLTSRTTVKAEANAVWQAGKWRIANTIPLEQSIHFSAPAVILAE